jgi:phosphate transport system permease protein
MDRRLVEERFFQVLMWLSLAILLGSLLTIVGTMLVKGFSSLSWAMVTQAPRGGYYLGKEGGVLNAIVGSIYLGVGATALALLAGLPIALFLNTYLAQKSRFARTLRMAMDVLWGIPSIVYGVFGFLVMLSLGLRASLGAAIATVALFELPIMVRAMDEVIRMIPPELEETTLSLGSTRLEFCSRVVTRQALPGLLTAVLMALGRGIGDTASVLFTAGFTDRVPTSLAEPAATLPLAIFFQLGTPFPEVQGRAYAAAAILTILVLVISIVSRLLARFMSRNVVR